MARLLLRRCGPLRDVVVEDRFGYRYTVPSLSEPIAFHLAINAVYELETMRFLLRFNREGSTFVDVGASIGCLSFPVARKVGKSGKVICIEPSPMNVAYLRRNVEDNGLKNVIVRECAATDEDSQVGFHEVAPEHFGMGFGPVTEERSGTSVPGRRLDSVLNEMDGLDVRVLKADVEGAEARVFRGSEKLLTGETRPRVVFEFCDWAEERAMGSRGAAQRVLMDWDYEIYRLTEYGKGRAYALRAPLSEGYMMLIAEPRECPEL